MERAVAGSWSNFLTSAPGPAGSPPPATGVPSYATSSMLAPPVPSSNRFAVHTFHQMQSSRPQPQQQQAGGQSASSPNTPLRTSKRARDETDAISPNAMHTEGDGDCGMVYPPQIRRLTSTELEQKYDAHDGPPQQRQAKKPCHDSLAVSLDAFTSGSSQSAASSPFMHLHPVAHAHQPSASLPASLSASPALFAMQAPQRTFHFSASAASSPMPLQTIDGSMFASSFNSHANGDLSSMLQHQQQPYSSLQRMSPHTPQIASMSLSSAHASPVPVFPFANGAALAQQAAAAQSSAAFSRLATPPPATFRPSSAPLHRPTMSITQVVEPWQVPVPDGPLDMEDGSERAITGDSPQSPVDATLDTFHPSTPSRTSPSHSSTTSLPHLQRMNSGGVGSGGGESTLRHGQVCAASIPSSLQSSHPSSPSMLSGSYAHFRSSSPSFERGLVGVGVGGGAGGGGARRMSAGGHPLAVSVGGTAATASSVLHTPTSSPLYVPDGFAIPSVEVGIGVLFMDRLACAQQSPTPHNAAHHSFAAAHHRRTATTTTAPDESSGMEE